MTCAAAPPGVAWMARPTTAGESVKHAQGQRGFTYILLLWWVAISGVLLAALGQQWLMESRRQKEAEFVFRGTEIGRALGSFQDATPAGMASMPSSLAELLEDKRGPKPLRHLRQLWVDPITGKPWQVDREAGAGRIVGIRGVSKAKPVKPPEGVERYSDWHFDASAWHPPSPASGASAPAPDAPSPATGAEPVRPQPVPRSALPAQTPMRAYVPPPVRTHK
jgi:type II secretory pathway pseudopilin PulG